MANEFEQAALIDAATKLSALESQSIRKLMEFATAMNADMGTAAKLLEPLSQESKDIAGPRIAVAQSLSNCVSRFLGQLQSGTVDFTAWAKAFDNCNG